MLWSVDAQASSWCYRPCLARGWTDLSKAALSLSVSQGNNSSLYRGHVELITSADSCMDCKLLLDAVNHFSLRKDQDHGLTIYLEHFQPLIITLRSDDSPEYRLSICAGK